MLVKRRRKIYRVGQKEIGHFQVKMKMILPRDFAPKNMDQVTIEKDLAQNIVN